MRMNQIALITLVLVNAAAGEPASRPAGEFLQALGPREWSFPRDHARHDGFKTEWWYFTGNLRDSAGRRFGYQLTFFRTAFTASPATRPSPWAATDLYFAHAAITDVEGKAFVYADRIARGRAGYALASDNDLDVMLRDWTLKRQADDSVKLSAADDKLSIDLTCRPGRGPILQGPGGRNPKGREPAEASYYYSMTRLPTSGTLTVNGRRFTVDGLSWMDHEFSSNQISSNQVGWDWIALHLADGRDLMLYRMRNKAGSADFLSGTLISADGKPRYLSAADKSLTPSGQWKSPASGGIYPTSWKIKIDGIPEMTLRPLLADQELQTPHSTDVTYYEGAVEALDPSGKPAGEGYLEMTGYAKPLSR